MQKVWIVARHEYWQHLRRRGFLLATFVMPVVLVVLFIIIMGVLIFSAQVDRLGYLDQSGVLSALDDRASIQVAGAIELVRYTELESGLAAVEDSTIQVLFIVPPDYIERGVVDAYVLTSLPVLARPAFQAVLEGQLRGQLAAAGASPRALRPLAATNAVVLDAPVQGASPVTGIVAPFLFSIIFLGSTFAGGSYLMSAIAEEKENRILEILASSLSPYQMMAGKIIGLGGLALTQLLIWTSGVVLIGVGVALNAGEAASSGVPSMLLLGLALFLPTYFIIAGTLAAIGAAVSSTQEGQQLTGVVTIVTTLPVWFLTLINRNPDGWLALALNIIPFTAPVTLVTRVLAAPIPLWQILATLVWLWLAAVAVMLIAGRIVEYGLRHFERRLSWREVLRLFRG